MLFRLVEYDIDDVRHVRDVDETIAVGIGMLGVERIGTVAEDVTDDGRDIRDVDEAVIVHVAQKVVVYNFEFRPSYHGETSVGVDAEEVGHIPSRLQLVAEIEGQGRCLASFHGDKLCVIADSMLKIVKGE